MVIHEYAETKRIGGKWTPKTARLNKYILDAVIELLDDKQMRAITKEDGRSLYRLLPQIPAHATKRYPGSTVREAIALADTANNTERLSPKSVNIWFTQIKSLFKWAVEHDYIEKSPMVVLKEVAEAAADEQRAFEDADLVAYFSHLADEIDPAMQWVPRLMLYAGLRLEEAAGLRGRDIHEHDSVWVVDVRQHDERRLKTASAVRVVPIHSATLQPLLAYARDVAPDGNLWGLAKGSSDTFSGALSKRLNLRIERSVVDSDKLVVYSLRHSSSTRLKQADVQEHVISELMGHKVDSLAVGRYGKKLNPARLKESVEKLTLPAETLP